MKLLLATLHAKYAHSSLALPYLAASCANCADLQTVIREWTVNEPHAQILRRIMAEQADIIAFSCYIWNIENTLRLADDIKKILPATYVILGGPEVSFDTLQLMRDNPAIDCVIKGEGESAFSHLIEAITQTVKTNFPKLTRKLNNIENIFFRVGNDIFSGPSASGYLDLDSVPSPFQAELVDLSKPLVYYETSRGCPFSCAFCLSSTEVSVQTFSMERIKRDLSLLISANVRQIKLVDRTFNYDPDRANHIWEFILANNQESRFHFEIAADLLTSRNMDLLKQVPPDTFGFEIGVQSAFPETLKQVRRNANLERIQTNVKRLREETSVALHLDLIAGLPDETYARLLESLSWVAALTPDLIQIEPLKILKGSPMRKIADTHGYSFSQFPPYTILNTPWLSFGDIGRIETIGRLLDLFYNRGGFRTALKFIQAWMNFSELFDRMAKQVELYELARHNALRLHELFADLSTPLLPDSEHELFRDALFFDYCRAEMPLRGKLPKFLRSDRHQKCFWPHPHTSELQPDTTHSGRIRVFKYVFEKDYRINPWKKGSTEITFVYESIPGQGLKNSILPK